MRFVLAMVLLLLTGRGGMAATGPIGNWLAQDGDGVITVTQCGDYLCARLTGIMLDHPDDPLPVDYRGVSQCHLALITDAGQIRSNLWRGHIINPHNGSVYGVELHMTGDGSLALRGFLGIPLLGETQTWTRYSGLLPANCRIMPAKR